MIMIKKCIIALFSITLLISSAVVLANDHLVEESEAEAGFRGDWYEPDPIYPPPPAPSTSPTVLPPTGGANHMPLVVSGASLLVVVVMIHKGIDKAKTC